MGLSHSDIEKIIYRDFLDPLNNAWLDSVFPDDGYFVYSQEGQLWKVPFKIDAEEKLQTGEKEAVKKDEKYVSMEAASGLFLAAVGEDNLSDDYGYTWRIQVVEYGLAKDGLINWPPPPLQAALPLYEGANVFCLNDSQHLEKRKKFGKSVRERIGWLENAIDTGKGIEADFQILRSAKWLRDDVIDSFNRGKKDFFGFSHDVAAMSRKRKLQGRTVLEPVTIVSVEVDLVYNPNNNGKFIKMVAAEAVGHTNDKEEIMLEKLLAALETANPKAYGALKSKIDAGTVDEGEVLVLLAGGVDSTPPSAKALQAAIADVMKDMGVTAPAADTGAPDSLQAAAQMLSQAKILTCGITLDRDLPASGLPDISQKNLRSRFENTEFKTEDLQAAIVSEKEYVDRLTGSGSVLDAGETRVSIILSGPDKLQAACDQLFGVEVEEGLREIPAFDGLTAAYVQMTGDSEIRGIPSTESLKLGESVMQMMNLPAAYSSSTFSFVLGNSMYRRLIQDYKAVDFNEEILLSYERNAKDFRPMESINVGYFGDTPDVDPEVEDYPEVAVTTDEEIIYSINQKGLIMSVHRKYLINDDLKSVMLLLRRLSRAARRTHARRAWNKIIDNATYKGDDKALFHVDHANLGSVGLTADATGITTLTNRLTAMFNQTEKDSGETLALDAEYIWCHRNLLEVVKQLNSPWPGATQSNPHAGRFGNNHEKIIVNKLATDTNDWGLVANANDVELLEVAYLNGRKEPEFFLADNPLAGQMFVADKIQYKQRHEYEMEITDTKGFDKSVVA